VAFSFSTMSISETNKYSPRLWERGWGEGNNNYRGYLNER